MTNETENTEKNRLVGRLSYLPYRAKGYGTTIGPVFSTSRTECRSVKVESIPMDLIRDMQRGEIGSFFIWDIKEEAGA